jgi:ABC-type multidrug transport system fused ATPase/permease subunit
MRKTPLERSDFKRSFRILSKNDKYKIAIFLLLQIMLGMLDLLGVAAIGLLGLLSISGLEGSSSSPGVNMALDFLNVSSLSFQSQVVVIGIVAALFLIGKTVFSILITRKVLFFLSNRGAQISSEMISRLLSQPLLAVQSRTTQATLYSITSGVSLLTLQVLATSIVLVSDFALLLIMGTGLFLVDPLTSLATLFVFTLVGFLLFRFTHFRANALGILNSQLNIKSNEKIIEVLGSYRELVVRNRRSFYSKQIRKVRYELAHSAAELSFMPYVSKYAIESAIVIGALLIGVIQFSLHNALQAAGTIGLFLAAGTRIAPAVLRIQQGLITIRSSLGQAQPTLDLYDSLGSAKSPESDTEKVEDKLDIIHAGFEGTIDIKHVGLKYPGNQNEVLSDVNLRINAGSLVAIVGPSGVGKSTLVDTILGILTPDTGSVLISGLDPLSAAAKWPGAISYVPQDVQITRGTIRENIAFGYPPEEATAELVSNAIKIAQLESFVQSLPKGDETDLGERGSNLSGGQRQRLGIARAMFTQPLLIVLDESTSALDSKTEIEVTQSIRKLRGTTTILMIAHRLSTIRDADTIVYLSEGKLLAIGTFEQVRARVSDFDRQAKLMGL